MRNELEDLQQQALEMAKQEAKKKAKQTVVRRQILHAIAPILPYILICFILFIVIVGCIEWEEIEASGIDLDLLPGTIYGNTIQEKVWYGMRSLGFSEISTAAAMGNFHHESGINAEAIEYGYNENNGGIGICQWTNSPRESGEGRNTQLKKYAESKGTTWQDENTQVEFLLAEISKSGSASEYATYQLGNSNYTGTSYSCDDWINAKDTATLDETKLRELTEIFCYTFERPSKSAGESSMDKRYAYALQYYEQFHGKEVPSYSYINSDLYNEDGSVNEAKMQELEYSIETSHNLVSSGTGFKNMYGTNNANSNVLKRMVTGTYHGYSYNIGSPRGKNGLLIYQCTWWANGRASEYLSQYGTKYKQYPTNSGNGGEYYKINKSNGWFKYGSEPRPNSLFSYNPTDTIYGHIVYVEAVDYKNGFIYVSESGGGTHWDGICKYSFSYCQRQINKNPNKYGFIYLSEPN